MGGNATALTTSLDLNVPKDEDVLQRRGSVMLAFNTSHGVLFGFLVETAAVRMVDARCALSYTTGVQTRSSKMFQVEGGEKQGQAWNQKRQPL